MNKKSFLYGAMTVLGIILFYNYIITPMLIQYRYRVGMGMHGEMYSTSNYIVDYRLILIILLILVGSMLYILLKPSSRVPRCQKCGFLIEDERWKICPRCGTSTKNRKGRSV